MSYRTNYNICNGKSQNIRQNHISDKEKIPTDTKLTNGRTKSVIEWLLQLEMESGHGILLYSIDLI